MGIQNEGLRGLVNGVSSADLGFPVLSEAKKVALVYTPYRLREHIETLLLLDTQLGAIALAQGEPMLKQIKLAWWREEISQEPDAKTPPRHPLVGRVTEDERLSSSSKTRLIDVWEQVATNDLARSDLASELGEARAIAFCDATGEKITSGIEASARDWSLFDIQRALVGASDDLSVDHEPSTLPVALPRALRSLAILGGLSRRAIRHRHSDLLSGRGVPFVVLRLGILGR